MRRTKKRPCPKKLDDAVSKEFNTIEKRGNGNGIEMCDGRQYGTRKKTCHATERILTNRSEAK